MEDFGLGVCAEVLSEESIMDIGIKGMNAWKEEYSYQRTCTEADIRMYRYNRDKGKAC